jgi:Uncharacterized protein conserved in bacteria
MKFLADMGISPSTAAFLRNIEYNAAHLHEQGLDRLSDPDILKSVISFRLRSMHPDRVNRYLHEIIMQHAEALEHGTIASVTEGQVRIRRLPLKTEG